MTEIAKNAYTLQRKYADEGDARLASALSLIAQLAEEVERLQARKCCRAPKVYELDTPRGALTIAHDERPVPGTAAYFLAKGLGERE